MKILIPKIKNIIEFPIDSVRLEEIDSEGNYIYYVSYDADPRQVVTNNVIKTEIYLSNVSYVTKEVATVFKNTKNGLDATKNILSSFAREKDSARAALKNFVSKQNSDISALMPTNKLPELSKSNTSIANLANVSLTGKTATTKTVVATQQEVVAKKVGDLKKDNALIPVVAININTNNTTTIAGKEITKSLATSNEASGVQLTADYVKSTTEKLLYNSAMDVSSLMKRSNNLPPAKKIIEGVITPKPTTKTELVIENPNAGFMVSTLINQINIKSIQELADDEYIDVVVKQKLTKIRITEKVVVSSSDITGGQFYITIFLIDSKGRRLEHISQLVNHSSYMKLYQIPSIPPSVTAMPVQKPGKISFFVQQIDKKANAINIYRREVNPNVLDIESGYKFAGKIDITAADGPRRVVDPYSGTNNCLYRFVPTYGDSYQAGIYASVGVKINSTNLVNTPQLRRPRTGSVVCEARNDGVYINISSVPYGPVAVKIYRKDLSLKEKEYKLVNNSVYDIGPNQSRSLLVIDKDVKRTRVYEYVCKYMFREGDEVQCSTAVILEYRTVESNVIQASIINQTVVEKSDGVDILFDIDYSPLLNNEELIRRSINIQGLTPEYQDEISKDRSKLSKLFTSTVTRKNTTTGEEEYFGIVDSVNFSDRKFGAVKNVKPPESGYEYEYTVTVYVRSPDTVFPNLTNTVQSQPGRPGYTYSPWKWQRPLSLLTGNIVTELANKANHAKPQAIQGEIADIQKVKVNLEDAQPSIILGSAEKIRSQAALLRWQISGSAKKIDHFVIIKDKMGMREIVMASHAITKDNYFEVVVEENEELAAGSLYVLMPVYYDGSRGKEFVVNAMVG